MANCPYCGSTNVYQFRRDLDWGGKVEYFRVAENGDYEDVDELHPIPDIVAGFCEDCRGVFDPFRQISIPSHIPVSAMRERIANLREHLNFKTKEHKAIMNTLVKKIQREGAEAFTKRASDIADAQKQKAYLDQTAEVIATLEYILEKDAVPAAEK